MRSVVALGLISLLMPVAWPDDTIKRADPKQPNVSITPRIRRENGEMAQSVVDGRADIRVDTTLVLIPVAVKEALSTWAEEERLVSQGSLVLESPQAAVTIRQTPKDRDRKSR